MEVRTNVAMAMWVASCEYSICFLKYVPYVHIVTARKWKKFVSCVWCCVRMKIITVRFVGIWDLELGIRDLKSQQRSNFEHKNMNFV